MDSITAQTAQKKFDLLTNETSGPSPTKEQLSDPREYVRYWSLINFMEIDEHRRILVNSKIQDDQTIFSTLVLDYKRDLASFRENKNNSKTGTIADKDLEHALGLKIRDYHDKLIRDLRSKINSQPLTQGLDELRKLVRALTGDERDYEVFLFAHWLQQVKRKVNGINPKWQMMLILYGVQGSGKTETVKKLIKVFHGLYSLLSVEQLVDIRVKNSIEDNYIIFLDE
jgi:signal recognition particle GTPase